MIEQICAVQTSAPRNPCAPRPPYRRDLCWFDPEADVTPPALFVPDHDLARWVNDHFLSAESPLLIVDHGELADARIGFVWTNVSFRDKGRSILGTAQLGQPTGKAWSRGAREQQLTEWFGSIPDLLVTLYAPFCAERPARQVLALIDHELTHFMVKVDGEGETVRDPETGRPQYALRGHDVEEFVDVVQRWGNWETGLRMMHAAGSDVPEMDLEAAERIVGPPHRF